MVKNLLPPHCACGSNKSFADCCEPYLRGSALPPNAEALMRSRYTAYTVMDEPYLLATWHPSTRPPRLDLASETQPQWIGLTVRRHEQQDETHATVDFLARYRVGGKAYRLEELSNFIKEEGRWFYVSAYA